MFADAYADARKQAAAETGLARAAFPVESGWDLGRALVDWDEGAELGAARDRGGTKRKRGSRSPRRRDR